MNVLITTTDTHCFLSLLLRLRMGQESLSVYYNSVGGYH